ncbi:hypothetical protein ACFV27_05980 [Streptomyces antimycoticus]|uniref:hypothetical protein n=1 Tax=Streptomyces antimycoticus TaxID=68175 RepID=UPI003696F1DE
MDSETTMRTFPSGASVKNSGAQVLLAATPWSISARWVQVRRSSLTARPKVVPVHPVVYAT